MVMRELEMKKQREKESIMMLHKQRVVDRKRQKEKFKVKFTIKPRKKNEREDHEGAASVGHSAAASSRKMRPMLTVTVKQKRNESSMYILDPLQEAINH